MSEAIDGVAEWGRKMRSLAGDTTYITTRVGAAAVIMIQARTAEGIDVDGQRFAPYSTKPAYIYDVAGSTSFRSTAKSLRKHGVVRVERGGIAESDRIRARNRKHGTPVDLSPRGALARHLRGESARGSKASGDFGPGFRTMTRSPYYFPGGYAQAKQAMGHGVEDLVVTGQMMGAMGNAAPFGVESAGPLSVVIAVLDQSQLRKMEGNNAFREFWGVGRTPDEHDRLQRVCNNALADLIRNRLRDVALPEGAPEP